MVGWSDGRMVRWSDGQMRKRRLNRHKQKRPVAHFIAGTAARTAASLVGVNKRTAACWVQRLREPMDEAVTDHTPFSGAVEIDARYFGGRRKDKRGARRQRENARI